MTTYTEDDFVTPLPCDIRHYYHTECVEMWFKSNQCCPICRTVITKEDIEKVALDFQKKLENSSKASPKLSS